ncbi:MAG TPA: hypothetical protein VKV79_08365 [Terriglobia bacterium]|nr:hypothetical protein [Terriglobia bacterium]
MKSHTLVCFTLEVVLVAFICAPAWGQYGGMGGTPSSTSGVYTPPKGGYSSSTGIAIGAGAAAAGVLAYLMLRNRGSIVGCVEESSHGFKLFNEKDKKTYALDEGNLTLKPGERLELSGKKVKSSSGEPAFEAKKLVKNYGSCSAQASLSNSTSP